MMNDIINERYPANQWNIYAAQASDGDNWADDSPQCREILMRDIMPRVRYYSYIEKMCIRDRLGIITTGLEAAWVGADFTFTSSTVVRPPSPWAPIPSLLTLS